jgi:hypothetical protein
MTTSSDPQPQQQEEPELNPCPFCGDGMIEVAGNEWEEDLRATCIGCLARSGRYRTKAEAIRSWNTRAADLPRATASIEDAARLADEYARRLRSINNHAVAAGVEVLAKEIRELAPRATVEAELTVESALKELREMFPDTVRIYVSDDADYFDSVLAREAFILVGHDMFRALTLDEAMNQVRAWSKSRAATSEGEDTK